LHGDLLFIEIGGMIIGIDHADPAAVGEAELVQVREIPARERAVDRLSELRECARAAHEQVGPGAPSNSSPPCAARRTRTIIQP